MRRPVRDAVGNIVIFPSTLRPQTPAETQDKLTHLVIQRVIDPQTAVWEMQRNGAVVDSIQAGAERKQRTEIAAMQNGQEPMPAMADVHAIHKKTIQAFVNDPSWLDLAPDAQARIQKHYILHEQAEMLLAQGQQTQGPPAGQPSPPGEAFATGQGQGAPASAPVAAA
jgi:hypothetical protein